MALDIRSIPMTSQQLATKVASLQTELAQMKKPLKTEACT
jgi:hypothetical protein